ncbi:hypothetical protein NM208_g16838 [Fusarium decemcellulare]|uniref:Uncharacterized protein n=1 Tax=Fusarium decemcellulare TaxID=57161 RepID=A0ACC1RBQ9_9HYPO|nr:hypothetical protein NM208_g16838 [Fusarium decemcellulare]
MRCNRKRLVAALSLLLTAQSAQAGPIWTGRIAKRGPSAFLDARMESQPAPTAAGHGSGGSETTPRPIFETLDSTIDIPKSLISQDSGEGKKGDTSSLPDPVEVVPIEETTEPAAPTTAAPEETTEKSMDQPVFTQDTSAPVLTTAITPKDPASNTQPSEATTAEEPVDATSDAASELSLQQLSLQRIPLQTLSQRPRPLRLNNLPMKPQRLHLPPTLTTAITPKDPASNTQPTSEATTAGDPEATTSDATEEPILTTTIVPKDPASTIQQPSEATTLEEPADETSDAASAPIPTTIVPKAPDSDTSKPAKGENTEPAQKPDTTETQTLHSSVDLGDMKPSTETTGPKETTAPEAPSSTALAEEDPQTPPVPGPTTMTTVASDPALGTTSTVPVEEPGMPTSDAPGQPSEPF